MRVTHVFTYASHSCSWLRLPLVSLLALRLCFIRNCVVVPIFFSFNESPSQFHFQSPMKLFSLLLPFILLLSINAFCHALEPYFYGGSSASRDFTTTNVVPHVFTEQVRKSLSENSNIVCGQGSDGSLYWIVGSNLHALKGNDIAPVWSPKPFDLDTGSSCNSDSYDSRRFPVDSIQEISGSLLLIQIQQRVFVLQSDSGTITKIDDACSKGSVAWKASQSGDYRVAVRTEGQMRLYKVASSPFSVSLMNYSIADTAIQNGVLVVDSDVDPCIVLDPTTEDKVQFWNVTGNTVKKMVSVNDTVPFPNTVTVSDDMVYILWSNIFPSMIQSSSDITPVPTLGFTVKVFDLAGSLLWSYSDNEYYTMGFLGDLTVALGRVYLNIGRFPNGFPSDREEYDRQIEGTIRTLDISKNGTVDYTWKYSDVIFNLHWPGLPSQLAVVQSGFSGATIKSLGIPDDSVFFVSPMTSSSISLIVDSKSSSSPTLLSTTTLSDFSELSMYPLIGDRRITSYIDDEIYSWGCPRNSAGEFCESCVVGYYSTNGKCEACPGTTLLLILVGIFVAFVLLLLMGYISKGAAMKDYAGVVIQIISFVQLVDLAFTLPMGLNIDFLDKFRIFTVYFNLGLESAGFECVSQIAYALKYALTVIIPVLVMAFLAVVGLVLGKTGRFEKTVDTLVRALVQGFRVLMVPMTVAGFRAFGCVQPASNSPLGYRLRHQMDIICFSSGEWWKLFPSSFIAFTVFTIFPSAMLFLYLRRLKKNNDESEDTSRTDKWLSHVIMPYRKGVRMWELVIASRKIILSAFVLLNLPPIASFSFCLIYMVLTVIFRPFELFTRTIWEVLLLGANATVFFAGQARQIASEPEPGQQVAEIGLYVGAGVSAAALLDGIIRKIVEKKREKKDGLVPV